MKKKENGQIAHSTFLLYINSEKNTIMLIEQSDMYDHKYDTILM